MERRLQRMRGTRSGNSANEAPLVTRQARTEVRYRDSPIRGALRMAGAADAAAARRACRERAESGRERQRRREESCECCADAVGRVLIAGCVQQAMLDTIHLPSAEAAVPLRRDIRRGFLHARRRRRNAGAFVQSSLAACVVSGVCTPRFIFPSHALSAASEETSRQPSALLIRHTLLLVGIEHRMSIPAHRFPWTVKALPCMKNAQRLRQTRALPQ